MKKNISICVLALLVSVASISANACPKGQHLTGGTGHHHKGGTCTKNTKK